MKRNIIIVSALLALPLVALAFNSGSTPNAVSGLLITDVIDVIFYILWPIVVAFSVLSFIVSAVLFMTAQDDPLRLIQARQALLFGVIGVAVSFLAFSVPFIIRNSIGNGI